MCPQQAFDMLQFFSRPCLNMDHKLWTLCHTSWPTVVVDEIIQPRHWSSWGQDHTVNSAWWALCNHKCHTATTSEHSLYWAGVSNLENVVTCSQPYGNYSTSLPLLSKFLSWQKHEISCQYSHSARYCPLHLLVRCSFPKCSAFHHVCCCVLCIF